MYQVDTQGSCIGSSLGSVCVMSRLLSVGDLSVRVPVGPSFPCFRNRACAHCLVSSGIIPNNFTCGSNGLLLFCLHLPIMHKRRKVNACAIIEDDYELSMRRLYIMAASRSLSNTLYTMYACMDEMRMI